MAFLVCPGFASGAASAANVLSPAEAFTALPSMHRGAVAWIARSINVFIYCFSMLVPIQASPHPDLQRRRVRGSLVPDGGRAGVHLPGEPPGAFLSRPAAGRCSTPVGSRQGCGGVLRITQVGEHPPLFSRNLRSLERQTFMAELRELLEMEGFLFKQSFQK